MSQWIYADNAASTKIDESVFEAMLPWLKEEYGNPSQPYLFVKKAKQAVKAARAMIATCINAEPDEIYFTSGGTESDNWVVKNIGYDSKSTSIITSAIEHHAILKACKRMEGICKTVKYLAVDREGVVSPDSLNRVLKLVGKVSGTASETILVSVMMANNEIGTVEPIKDLAEVAHSHGAWFHTDAVQALGHIAIDVKELGVDMLSASAHKFNGPKGVGFLYLRKGVPLLPHNDGGTQERNLRAGTENVAGIVGMATALKANCERMQENANHISDLENRLIKGISSLNYIRNGALNHIPGNISISFRDTEGEAILHRLDLKHICVSTGAACDSVHTRVSHVIRAIGVPKEFAKGTIRISLGKNNTVDEIDTIIAALNQIVGK